MSGGHFNYTQQHIHDIAEEIDEAIVEFGSEYNKQTLDKFRIASEKLREAHIYAQRVDWLLSGDDGEVCFHRRLSEDMAELHAKLHDDDVVGNENADLTVEEVW